MNEIVKKQSVKFGLIVAAASIAYTLIIYAIDISLIISYLAIIVSLFYIVITIIGVISVKREQQGFITFKEAFTTYFLISLIYILINTAFNKILFNVIDPAANAEIKELVIQKQEKLFENLNVPEDMAKKQPDEIRNTAQFSIMSVIKNIFLSLLIFSIVGLIVSAIVMRRDVKIE